MSEVLRNLWASTPLSAVFKSQAVELPIGTTEPLMPVDKESSSQKCDLRIEGMTCGACVEVRGLLANRIVLTDILLRPSRECSAHSLEYIPSKSHCSLSGVL